jgi:hypothetical protein
MNAMRKELYKKALEWNKTLENRKASAQERRQTAEFLSKFASSTMSSMM